MRITINIAAKDLQQIQRLTREKNKSAAVAQALSDYLRRRLIERAISGKTHFSLTNEELEQREVLQVS